MQTPIDFIEDVVSTEDWSYHRINDDEMIVELSGRWCDYRLHFFWQPEISVLHISSYLDIQIHTPVLMQIYQLMALINEKLVLGHFEISGDDIVPSYRYAFLLNNDRLVKSDYIEDIMEIIINECERFYPAFQYVIQDGKLAEEALSVALVDTIGEA